MLLLLAFIEGSGLAFGCEGRKLRRPSRKEAKRPVRSELFIALRSARRWLLAVADHLTCL